MKLNRISLTVVALLAAAAACAQDANPPGNTAPNINSYGNPTAAAQLPSNFVGDPMAPTYPAGNNMPAWRGGTMGADPAKAKGAPDRAGERKAKLRRERSLPEPDANQAPSNASGSELAPEAGFAPPVPTTDVNPGALQGGTQP